MRYIPFKPVPSFYGSTDGQSYAMHFRRLKFKKKDKVSPEDTEYEDIIPNPPEQPEAAVMPVPLPPKEPRESMNAEPSPPPDQQSSSPVPGPLGPALSDNKEIQQIWAEIQEKVASLAQRDGRSVNTGMEIGDVMGTLESTEHRDVEPGKRDEVKKVFGNTLKVIQTVGGFVADGASQVRDTRPQRRCCGIRFTDINRSFLPRRNAIMPSALSLMHGKATRARSMVSQTFLMNARNILHGWRSTPREK
jgi:hypothetical protein